MAYRAALRARGVAFVLIGALGACTFDFDAPFSEAPGGLDAGGDVSPDHAKDVTLDEGDGGSGGTAATGGSGGTAATGGSGGTAATGGSGGTAATGGSGGTAATGGSGGTAATGGSGGTAATGGSGGISGSGGSGGISGSGGSSGSCLPVGHDEDQDGADDACDVCPSVADPSQMNADLDEIGDACENASPGLLSTIERFSSWNSEANGWNLDAHATLVSDALRLSRTCAGQDCVSVAYQDADVTGTFAAETVFRLDANGDGWAGIAVGLDPSAGVMLACELARNGGSLDLQLWVERFLEQESNQIAEEGVSAPSSEPSEHDQRMRVTWDGDELVCELTSAGGASASLVVPLAALGEAPEGKIGVMVFDASAGFSSFVQYGP